MTKDQHGAAIEWAYSDGIYDDNDHNAFYAGAKRATREFTWRWDERTN
jgi:hypothetical protein